MGQVKDALQELQKSPYASQEGLASDKKYFLKKMGWSEKDLCDYLSSPEIPHDAYSSDRALWDWICGIG